MSSVKIILDQLVFLLALAHISLLNLYLSNNRGLTNSYNLYRPCLFNLLLIVIKDILVLCLLIDIEISASILIIYFFTIEIISRFFLSEVFFFISSFLFFSCFFLSVFFFFFSFFFLFSFFCFLFSFHLSFSYIFRILKF